MDGSRDGMFWAAGHLSVTSVKEKREGCNKVTACGRCTASGEGGHIVKKKTGDHLGGLSSSLGEEEANASGLGGASNGAHAASFAPVLGDSIGR